MFPMMFDVLVNKMMPASLTASFTVDKYLGLLMEMTVAFGLVFELPLVLAFLASVGIVQASSLRRFRKYWLIAAFVIGAVLTPADPISQTLMAAPLILFYEVGIILASILGKRREQALALIESERDTAEPTP
jgi:sec-independent protein translocase protein TatC